MRRDGKVVGKFPGRVVGAGEVIGFWVGRMPTDLRGEFDRKLRSCRGSSHGHGWRGAGSDRTGHRNRRCLRPHGMRRKGHREGNLHLSVRAWRHSPNSDGLRALDHKGGLALWASHGHAIARNATLVELEGILAAWASDFEHRSPSTARRRGLSLRDRDAPTSASLGCALPASPDRAPHRRAETTSRHRLRPSGRPQRRWRSPDAASPPPGHRRGH